MKSKRVRQMICDTLNYIDNYQDRVYTVENGDICSYLITHHDDGGTALEFEGLAYIGGNVSVKGVGING